MLTSLHIKNFRCFEDFEIGPLARVNLIAGKNNVGKTALLEALFLYSASDDPLQTIALNSLRGLERNLAEPEEVWGWLFFSRDTSATVEIAAHNHRNFYEILKLRLVSSRSLSSPSNDINQLALWDVSMPDIPSTTIRPRDLLSEFHSADGTIISSRVFLTHNGWQRSANRARPLMRSILLSTHKRPASEDPENFSNLVAVGRQQELVSTLKILEPRLQNLAVLVTGGAAVIHGDIGIGRLVPLAFMGEGMAHLLTIILSIASSQHGTVLIDEVETGLHYSVMQNVWKAIAQAAREYDVQVFATTHSYECIEAAHRAFEDGSDDDFRLHRLDRVGEAIKATTYNEKTLGTSINAEMEVR